MNDVTARAVGKIIAPEFAEGLGREDRAVDRKQKRADVVVELAIVRDRNETVRSLVEVREQSLDLVRKKEYAVIGEDDALGWRLKALKIAHAVLKAAEVASDIRALHQHMND